MKREHKPAISVIMSAYNSERYITQAIESILNQTFKDFEFIIINDASTDKTLNIIKKYAKKDKRIKIINKKTNSGAADSRNKGLKISKGEYIAIMDADDISLPERFKIQYNYLEDNPKIFLVGGSYELIDSKGNKLNEVITSLNPQEVAELLPKKNIIHNPTVMLRNIGVPRYRIKFEQGEDYDLWLRFLTEGKKLSVLLNIIIKYRFHPNSYTTLSNKKQTLFVEKARQFYFERVKRGLDHYNFFNVKEISNSNEKVIGKGMVQIKEIKFFFRNSDDMKRFRKLIKEFWKEEGILKWKKGILYFIISFMPSFLRFLIRKKIWEG